MNKTDTTKLARINKAVGNVAEIKRKADELVVCDTASMTKAVTWLKQLAGTLKQADEARKEITGPINITLRVVNERYKTATAPLSDAMTVIRGKVEAFKTSELKRERAEREKENKKIERRARYAESKGNDERVALLRGQVAENKTAPVSSRDYTGAATVSAKLDFAGFVVLDITKVPPEFLMVNETALRAAYKKGIRNVDGLEIKEAAAVRVR